MVFNVLAHNRDDHVKNFSYLLSRDGSWRLAPAYDLMFTAGIAGEHTMGIAGEALNPTRKHMLALAEEVDLSIRDAIEIIEKAQEAVERWPSFARNIGVPTELINEIAGAHVRV